MITRDYWRLSHPNTSCAASYGTRAMCEEWRDRNPLGRPRESYVIAPVPCCGCCGSDAVVVQQGSHCRCEKHRGRNPCAIEGCSRTTAAPENGRLAEDGWICDEHWRRFVPPRSSRRRAYHAFFRKAKRHGWDERLRRQFWRFWGQLVATARAKQQTGTIDIREIERLFGPVS